MNTGSIDSALKLVVGSISLPLIVISVLLTNLAQMASLVLYLFSPKFAQQVACVLAEFWWNLVMVAFRFQGGRLIITGDPVPATENAILIPNHQGNMDTFYLFYLSSTVGRMKDTKWFSKEILRYLPGIGWGLWMMGCIFVKRNWADDQKVMDQAFRRYTSERIPIWLVTFLEGTRKTPAKLRASQEYASKIGAVPLNHVLMPRTKGFVATVHGLRGHMDAVYDVTFGYEGPVPGFKEVIFGRLRPLHVHFRRFAMNDVPKDSKALADWVMERFREKDRILEGFLNSGSFPQKR